MSGAFMNDFSSFKVMCEKIEKQDNAWLLPDKPVFIFGAGQFGRDVCTVLVSEGFVVLGFIESIPRDRQVLGLPVLTWGELRSNHLTAQLVIGIFNREMPLDDLIKLSVSSGFADIFLPWDVYNQFGKQLGWRFWLSAHSLIVNNLSAIEKTYHSLSDDISKHCLLEICAFRLGRYNAYASFRSTDQQYFNGLTLKGKDKGLCYIDGGAYNGDTYFELSEHAKVTNAYLFEPDPDNYKTLVGAVKNVLFPIMCMPIALGDAYQILTFNAGSGEGGTISEMGRVHITAAALDDMLNSQHIDFIKLDVEGAEINALRGSMKIIKRCRPILAISLYHRPEDIWEISELLGQLCENYCFYIRQHFYNSFECVFYAIPK